MSLVDDTLKSFKSRLQDLEQEMAPMAKEAEELRAAIASLEGGGSAPAAGRRPASSGGGGGRRAASSSRRGRTPTGRARRGEARQKVLDAAREHPGYTSGQIAEVTGIARSTVATTMSKLRAAGELPRPEKASGSEDA